jgi:hypothetical protein
LKETPSRPVPKRCSQRPSKTACPGPFSSRVRAPF